MKKILLLLIVLISFSSFSQAISVDTNTYTVPQLVNNVLINSSCVNASNINWRTGTNFGSVNGIGYFQNTNPNFPMKSGVILSTGNVLEATGPNTSMLSSGSTSWLGDSDLEATLAASGISMVSTNATVLEFQFVPISSHFDFNFLFASEEYGNFQCQFSDAFAFLLTDMTTGITTNLAVVPGTNNPISVVTIRDFLYNSICPSANSQYFGSFNGGTYAASSATNFNGQTKLMNASSVLIPNRPYKIKLVIADRGDYKSDSAIFLSSDSFNIGQNVLGNDLTVASNTAICNGQTHLIDSGLDPTLYTFVWKKDGVVIAGQNGPSLSVNQPGTYELTYTNSALVCQSITNSVIIEYYPIFTTQYPKNIYVCDSGQASYNFNLDYNTPIVLTGITPNAATVSYFANSSDANSNSNALPLTYSSPLNTTIYVRIKNNNTGCYSVKSFQLLSAPTPLANHPDDFVKCADSNGKASFNLSSLNSNVLNGQSNSLYKVSYYKTLTDANAGTNPVSNRTISINETIYIRVQLINDSTCYSINSVNLIVAPIPLVDTIQSLTTCTNYILPPLTNGNYFTQSGGTGTPMFAGDVISETQTIFIYNVSTTAPFCSNESSFTITIIVPSNTIPSSYTHCGSFQLPALSNGEYHTQPNGSGVTIPAGTVLNTSQTVYYYYVLPTPPYCVIDQPTNYTIIPAQIVPTLSNVFDCTSYILQPLSFGNYYDAPNGTGNLIAVGTAVTSSKTIYIHGVNPNGCTSDSSFEVTIGANFPTSVTECVQYTLPALSVGNYYTAPGGTGTLIPAGTTINTTQTIYVYAITQSQTNCTTNYNFTVTISIQPAILATQPVVACESYTLPPLTTGNYYSGTGGTGTMFQAGDIIYNSTTLYVYVTNSSGCTNEVNFTITINPKPVIDSRGTIDACHSYTLTNLIQGNYYTGPGGTGTIMPGGTILNSSQLIYIYASVSGCTSETSFQVDVHEIDAYHAQNVASCDSYMLPALPVNNKYYTQTGGQYGNGVEIPAGTVITSSQTLYIFIESGGRINCTDESNFTVTITSTPVINSIPNVYACNSYTLPLLSTGDYYTESNKGGTKLNAGDVITSNQTLYVYAESISNRNCSNEKSFTITIFNVDNLPNVTSCSGYVLPTLVHGNYYNAPNGTGGTIAAGTSITSNKTIYIFAHSGYVPDCSDESSFTITIIPQPIVNTIPIAYRTTCDTDGTNDGIFNFNLSQLTSHILGSQTTPEFSVNFYQSFNDANTGINSVTSSSQTTVYVRVNNALAPNCYDIKAIQLIINKLPKPNPIDGIICINSKTGVVINPYMIYSGLSTANYSIKWYNQQGHLVGSGANYQAILPGVYTVIAISNTTGCASAPIPVTVSPSEPAIVTYVVDGEFNGLQTVTVTATGTGGNYEYEIDNGGFQDSPIFNNVEGGFHTIAVRDRNGCGTTITDAVVLDYPHFFTPNGDGNNDTWNIKDLRGQSISLIYIYDRYGKLIKKIRPSGAGWDGTYDNTLMPSDDYWFTVNYQKDGEEKEFKAHFAMKR